MLRPLSGAPTASAEWRKAAKVELKRGSPHAQHNPILGFRGRADAVARRPACRARAIHSRLQRRSERCRAIARREPRLPRCTTRVAQSYLPGFNATVFMGRQTSRRLGVRFDLSISRVSGQQTRFVDADPMAGTCWGRCPVQSAGASVGIAALTANVVAMLTGANRAGQLYLIAGIGPYYVYENPEGPCCGAGRRIGWRGVGSPLGVGGRSRLFVRRGFQHLFDSPTEMSWMAPVTVGIRF